MKFDKIVLFIEQTDDNKPNVSKKDIMAGLESAQQKHKELLAFRKQFESAEKNMEYYREYEGQDGVFIVYISADYEPKVVDHVPGYAGSRGRDIYANVPSEINDYIVAEMDEEGNANPVDKETEDKYLAMAWDDYQSNSDYWERY